VQAVERVGVVARVVAFLEERRFTEGDNVNKGDLLYRLERGPYEADLAAKQAAVAQAEATHVNAQIQLNRAEELLRKQSGSEATRDNALAEERSSSALLLAAKAQVRQSQINLDYTEIRAPIDGRIGRTAVTIGNVVGPSSGVLATIVSQDPIYVTFPVPVRTVLELRNRYAAKGGFAAVVIKLLLPDGRTYDQTGKLDFIDIDVGQNTDTITLRGTISNPILDLSAGGDGRLRELTNEEFVTVVLEGAEPVQRLTLAREAVLSDQRGDFVYVVDADSRARRRAVQLGQSTAATAVIASGLKEGEKVVVEGVQRVQPDAEVSPGPISTEASVTAAPE
jgi:membrane fusion protein (multidrug efflux system)